MCASYSISGHAINIGASIGIAVIDRRARDAGDIPCATPTWRSIAPRTKAAIAPADYDTAMDADLSQRKLLESDLLHAIRNDGLCAANQPIVNAIGDTMVGVEALARWTHPTAGVIPPSTFIPIAENSGLIAELGEWMLRRACLDGFRWPGLTVAVNVSPLQFRRSDFVDVVERILKETDFDPCQLELELTESTLLGNLETAELLMLRLKSDRGAFRTRRFRYRLFEPAVFAALPVRQAQDRFELCAQHRNRAGRGRDRCMRWSVSAAGWVCASLPRAWRTREQHLFLRAAGVHSMQGYRFGRPGPAADISARMASPDDYRVGNPDQEIALAS